MYQLGTMLLRIGSKEEVSKMASIIAADLP